ncbi:MAG TPA: DNA topoisomerase (ATP-hydrolyzing) subunit B [Candidatus Solibacter sp.]|nr:DNA topoisomerase (ATP-hydrolyzing) subunit B [Candidatus Solibacter sp.]
MSEAAAKLPPNRGKGASYDAKNIQVLEGLEAVRRRPGMYIGSTDTRGLHHLLYEIVDNSIDEAMGGHADEIVVTLHKDGAASVSDNGRGIPVGIMPKQKKPALEVVMTVLHAGGKFGGGGYKVSGGLHGVGMSVVNALSEKVQAWVYLDSKIHYQEYARGKPVAPLATQGKTTRRGTTIKFYPDPEVFEEMDFHWEVVAHRLRELAFLNKGTTIKLVDERGESPAGPVGTEYCFYFEGGLKSFVRHLNQGLGPINIPPVYVEKGIEGNMVEVALQYNAGFSENILAFANNINTMEGGSHLTGFRSALTSVLNRYARQAQLIKESDPNLGGDDVREGLTAVISVKIQEPQFEGQTKTKLGNSEVAGQVQAVFGEGLMEYLMEHPSEARRIIEKSVIAARAREAARKARDLVQRKSLLESSTLPGKLADCSERDPERCEIFIVEGDSAGGSAKQGRQRTFQAILPLRGKILNVHKAREDKVLASEEIRNLITALGCGVGERYDPDKLRYHRVIIATDADVDGSHIRTLLLTFFWRYMRELVDRGHIYIAQPPLYKIEKGKAVEYVYTEEEKTKAMAKLDGKGGSEPKVQRYKGLGEMNPEQLWETTMDPENRILLRVDSDDGAAAERLFETLMGVDVDPRKQFIKTHAKNVRNLDI